MQPFDPIESRCELRYRGPRGTWIQRATLALHPDTVSVVGDRDGVVVLGSQPLLDREELIRLSLGVLAGGPLTLRAAFEELTLAVNLSDHIGDSLGRLAIRHDDAGVLLQGIYDFLSGLPAPVQERWRRATLFFLQGIGGASPFEIRTISLFTFLEMIDDTKTLSPNALATLLQVEPGDATLLASARNRMIHHGDDLGDAFFSARAQLRAASGAPDPQVFDIDCSDRGKAANSFFFKFAMLLNKLWITRAHFAGAWRDFSEFTD